MYISANGPGNEARALGNGLEAGVRLVVCFDFNTESFQLLILAFKTSYIHNVFMKTITML